MITVKKQYYNIKFPFTKNNEKGLFIDLNETLEEGVASRIAHIVLTPKRSRVRRPNFGTDLIKYIFEPSDSLSWENVESEVREAITTYVPNVTIGKIEIKRNESNENEIYVVIAYTVKKGNLIENNELTIKI